MAELEERDRAILAMERRVFAGAGAKEAAVWAELSLTPTAYYQRLNALLASPAALAEDPVLVNRLRRARDARLRSRRARG